MATTRTIHAKLAAARRSMDNPPMNGKAQYGKYATLGDVLNVVLPPLISQGLMVRQGITPDGILETIIYNDEGETLTLDARPINLEGNSQQQGSAETYAKRYALCTAFALVGVEDDDGAAASQPQPTRAANNSAARNKAIKRLNAAMEAYSAATGKTVEEVKAGVKARDDYADTADFYNLVAEELETA